MRERAVKNKNSYPIIDFPTELNEINKNIAHDKYFNYRFSPTQYSFDCQIKSYFCFFWGKVFVTFEVSQQPSFKRTDPLLLLLCVGRQKDHRSPRKRQNPLGNYFTAAYEEELIRAEALETTNLNTSGSSLTED